MLTDAVKKLKSVGSTVKQATLRAVGHIPFKNLQIMLNVLNTALPTGVSNLLTLTSVFSSITQGRIPDPLDTVQNSVACTHMAPGAQQVRLFNQEQVLPPGLLFRLLELSPVGFFIFLAKLVNEHAIVNWFEQKLHSIDPMRLVTNPYINSLNSSGICCGLVVKWGEAMLQSREAVDRFFTDLYQIHQHAAPTDEAQQHLLTRIQELQNLSIFDGSFDALENMTGTLLAKVQRTIDFALAHQNTLVGAVVINDASSHIIGIMSHDDKISIIDPNYGCWSFAANDVRVVENFSRFLEKIYDTFPGYSVYVKNYSPRLSPVLLDTEEPKFMPYFASEPISLWNVLVAEHYFWTTYLANLTNQAQSLQASQVTEQLVEVQDERVLMVYSGPR